MDVNNENRIPVTELELDLVCSNQCIQSRLNSDSGAGANAGPRIGMKFMATEPLSELVWSRDKGPSNVTLSPPQSITSGKSTAEKPMDEENFVTPQTPFDGKSEVSGKETGANIEEMKTAEEVSVLHKQEDICSPINLQVDKIPETEENFVTTLPGNIDREGADILVIESEQVLPFVGENEPLLGEPVSDDRDVDIDNQKKETDVLLISRAYPVNERKASSAPEVHQKSQGRRQFDKPESADNNDLRNLKTENASQNLGSHYPLGNKESFEKVEEMIDNHSPTNSRIQKHRRKGKEKALSDGDCSGGMSKEENDSHESVESCNSTGLLSSGKRRWIFEEQFSVGSKRFRQQIQEAPGSYIRQESSFMNWISSMTKGFPKSMDDETPPLALTITHPDHSRQTSDKKAITCDNNQDPRIKSIGFQSILQSLYCPRGEDLGTRISSGDHEIGERSIELEPAMPKLFHGEKVKLGQGRLLSVGNINKSATQTDISSIKVAHSLEKDSINFVENKTSYNLEFNNKKCGVGPTSSLGKLKLKNAENIESDPKSEGRIADKCFHRNNLLKSLWITRFTPKISGPSLISDHHSGGVVLECSNDHKNMGGKEQSVENIVIVSGNKLQDCTADNKVSLAFSISECQSDLKSNSKLSPIFSVPKFSDSEAMASVFARRVDALKHINPSGQRGDAEIMTCFFCGIKGHHLRECLAIKGTELQTLQSKFKSYTGAENFPRFCIRCFQCSHWAVACPSAPSVGQPQLECNFSSCIDSYCNPNGTKLIAEGNMKLLFSKENQLSVEHTFSDEGDSRVETDLNLSWKKNIASKSMTHSSKLYKRYNTSRGGQNKFKEKQGISLSVSSVPKGIFDSVKRLRLSRRDVLKWMNSHSSLSNLEGFYLRLRLGKCEAGGTGYYVSCITGEVFPPNAESSISVIVGGVRCLIESQYISNHDFLEDELRAWWSATSKSNAKTPSEEDLREKVKMKNMLGL